MKKSLDLSNRPQSEWLVEVAAPIWQMLTGIGQLRAGEAVRLVGGTAREQAFAAEAAGLLGADAVLKGAEPGEAQLMLLLEGSADLDLVSSLGRIVLRAGATSGCIDAAVVAARGLTLRGFDAGLWVERQPEQLRDIVGALESCRASCTGPLATLSQPTEADPI